MHSLALASTGLGGRGGNTVENCPHLGSQCNFIHVVIHTKLTFEHILQRFNTNRICSCSKQHLLLTRRILSEAFEEEITFTLTWSNNCIVIQYCTQELCVDIWMVTFACGEIARGPGCTLYICPSSSMAVCSPDVTCFGVPRLSDY